MGKKLYLAGPQCFYPNSELIFEKYCKALEKYGFERSEAEIEFCPGDSPHRKAEKIFLANINSIKNCDIVIADINNFRGWEPDSGTCFEIGAAHIWDKPVYGYIDDMRSCAQKFSGKLTPDKNGTLRDCDGLTLEGGCANAMLVGSMIIVEGTFYDALDRVAADLCQEEG